MFLLLQLPLLQSRVFPTHAYTDGPSAPFEYSRHESRVSQSSSSASSKCLRRGSLPSTSSLSKIEGSHTKDENFPLRGNDSNDSNTTHSSQAHVVSKRKPLSSKSCSISASNCSSSSNNSLDVKTLPLTPGGTLYFYIFASQTTCNVFENVCLQFDCKHSVHFTFL